MRKPRDYDAELRALDERARELRTRKLGQLGELVIATGADALDAETLAGALLAAAAESKDNAAKEAWRRRGAAFFQGPARRTAGSAAGGARGNAPAQGGTLPLGLEPRKA